MHGTISHFSKTTKLALRPRQFFLNFNDVAGTSSGVKGASNCKKKIVNPHEKKIDILRFLEKVDNIRYVHWGAFHETCHH